ncbi:hypothetical protein GCK72_011422 [Caenorhabditis remanei]|uniref:DUF38 domain-containing protein n=1 Tax=Caenorhabditis remanei TaxID=31234 RepID=A0A6A5H8F7_CAERE|nr:hypothetical protein GCK72_011422 [Caenorhabditis remanei]KAF1763156.1 hypothetical protein GCK72_011422 [Caenorhabditis remanei]
MPPVFKQNIIEGMLYTLHFQRVPPKKAYVTLKRMTGEETMSLEQIKDLFQQMDAGTFDLRDKEGEQVSMERAKNVKAEQHVDVMTRLQIHKICSQLPPSLVHEAPQYIRNFIYFYGNNFIELSINNVFHVRYELEPQGITAEHADHQMTCRRFATEKDFPAVLRQKLTAIFGNRNLEIGTMKIHEDINATYGMKVLRRVLRQMNRKFNVKTLKYYVLDVDKNLTKIVKTLTPKYLESLIIHHFQASRHSDNFDTALYETEQWKKLKMVRMKHYLSDLPTIIEHWTHMERSSISYKVPRENVVSRRVVLNGFDELLEKYLENENLFEAHIYIRDFNDTAAYQLKQAFKEGGEFRNGMVYFESPFGDGKPMCVEFSRTCLCFLGPAFIDPADVGDVGTMYSSEEEEEEEMDEDEEEAEPIYDTEDSDDEEEHIVD